MKVIGFDPKDWPMDALATRMAALLGMEHHPIGPDGGFALGTSNDYWIFPSTDPHLPPGTWELHARYEHTLRDKGVQEALLVLLKERFYLENVFIIDFVNVPGDKQHTRLITITPHKSGGYTVACQEFMACSMWRASSVLAKADIVPLIQALLHTAASQ